MTILKIGSRCSKLAITQAKIVVDKLKVSYPELKCEVIGIKTSGDIMYDQDLSLIGGKGLFLKELEEALLNGKIDLAVHSMKDVPAHLDERLIVYSLFERQDARDVLISSGNTLLQLAQTDGIIGTCSKRRAAQLKKISPGLKIVPMRGNVETRLSKVQEGVVDAIVLAYAGVQRLGLEKHIVHVFEQDEMVPAIGQGAIGLEFLKDNERIMDIVSKIAHKDHCIEAERAFMMELGGDCTQTIGAYAIISKNHSEMHIRAIYSHDGEQRSLRSLNISMEYSKNTTLDECMNLGRRAAKLIRFL